MPKIGTFCSKKSTNGNSMELNLEVLGSVGVCPPCLNKAIPIITVRPEAKMFIASPDITWFPL